MITLELGCDHAGFELKEQIKKSISSLSSIGAKIQWNDHGTFSADSVDYPDLANKVCQALKQSHGTNLSTPSPSAHFGLLICGSGQGMAMRANKFSFIRAALCTTAEQAKLSREHNDANVLCFGARGLDFSRAQQMIEVFLSTDFAGGRHAGRVEKIARDT